MDERVIDSTHTSLNAVRTESRTADRIAVLVLALLLLPTYLWTGATFDNLDVYEQYNVLYDADPNTRLPCFANGWGDGRSFVHPNLCNLVNPVIRLIAAPAELVGLAEAETVRRQLALAVAPTFAVAAVGVLFLTTRRVGCRMSIAFPVALLYGFSFSQWIFGSIPDHFALGGLSLTLALWLLVDSVQRGHIGVLRWAAAGAFAASITISNLALFGLVFLAAAVPTLGRVAAVRQGALVALLALAMTFAVKVPLDALYGSASPPSAAAAQFTVAYVRDQPASNLAQYPGIVVGAFAAPQSTTLPQREALSGGHYDFQFSLIGQAYTYTTPLARAAAATMAILLVAATLAAAYRYRAGFALDRVLTVAIGGIIATNGLLHAVWGSEYILYSQHWLGAAVLTLAFLARTPLASSRALPVAFTLAAALVMTANLEAIVELQTLLAGSARS